ncbi:tripartite tricarboxylate transporter TctB family protein, partial [Staphylococcus equorum]
MSRFVFPVLLILFGLIYLVLTINIPKSNI